jgi:hypothetical protein
MKILSAAYIYGKSARSTAAVPFDQRMFGPLYPEQKNPLSGTPIRSLYI